MLTLIERHHHEVSLEARQVGKDGFGTVGQQHGDAIDRFEKQGRKAGWGGAKFALGMRLVQEGCVDEGLRLMEFDMGRHLE